MDHVASVPSATSGRMSPEAIVLAVVLHAVAALALWWLAEHAPTIVPGEDPIEVTIERSPPKPPTKPIPLLPEWIQPPAKITADKRTQVRPSGEAPKDVAVPPHDSLEE